MTITVKQVQQLEVLFVFAFAALFCAKVGFTTTSRVPCDQQNRARLLDLFIYKIFLIELTENEIPVALFYSL